MDFFHRIVIYCIHAIIYEKYFQKEAIQDSLLISDCQTVLRGRYRTFIVILYGVGSLLIEVMYLTKFRGKVCVLIRTICYVIVLYGWESLLIWSLKTTGSCPDYYVTREFDWDQLVTFHFPFCFALCFYLDFLVSYVHSVDISMLNSIQAIYKKAKNQFREYRSSDVRSNGSATIIA